MYHPFATTPTSRATAACATRSLAASHALMTNPFWHQQTTQKPTGELGCRAQRLPALGSHGGGAPAFCLPLQKQCRQARPALATIAQCTLALQELLHVHRFFFRLFVRRRLRLDRVYGM